MSIFSGLDLYRIYVFICVSSVPVPHVVTYAPMGIGSVDGAAATPPPIEYTMMLHPPLVVENLLPHAGTFELVDQVRSKCIVCCVARRSAYTTTRNNMEMWCGELML